MRFAFTTITLSLFLMMTLVACGNLGSSSPKTFHSVGKVLAVDAPGQWIDYDLHDDGDLEIAHRTKELYLLVLSEPVADFDGTAQEYSDDVRYWIHDSVTGMQETGPRSMTIHGQPAIQYTIRGTIDGISIVYLHTVIKTDGYFHQLTAWATAREFASSETVLQDLIASAREPGSAPAQPADAPEEVLEESPAE
ncbi:hypothetical protein OT109_17645 [Phycisphaeraceae bacterium D3-23]